jgi:hypothetical protein
MKQLRMGKHWPFEMNRHIGTDPRGIVHTVTATNAAVADLRQLPELLHEQERAVFGDWAFWKEDHRKFLEAEGALPDQSASWLAMAVERAPADDQPGPFADPRPR